MMLGKKTCPERDVRKMLDNHIEMVGAVMYKGLDAIAHYLNDNIDEAKASAKEVDQLESRADGMLRNVMRCLQGGAFLPIMRKDMFQLVSAVDEVANATEGFCDFCLSQRPQIPKDFRKAFLEITRSNIKMFPDLKQAVATLHLGKFGWLGDQDFPFEKIARKIGITESDIDDLEWKLTREIFNSDLPLANKMHIRALLTSITRVSDLIEDAVDRIHIMITREAI
jgi:predicted phosphate transport protein (TIGR00153 family)